MKNGFEVTGFSGCVDKEKFAREKAIDKAWEVEGYLLQEEIHNNGTDTQT